MSFPISRPGVAIQATLRDTYLQRLRQPLGEALQASLAGLICTNTILPYLRTARHCPHPEIGCDAPLSWAITPSSPRHRRTRFCRCARRASFYPRASLGHVDASEGVLFFEHSFADWAGLTPFNVVTSRAFWEP